MSHFLKENQYLSKFSDYPGKCQSENRLKMLNEKIDALKIGNKAIMDRKSDTI